VPDARPPRRLRPDPGLLVSAAAGVLLFLLLFEGWFGLREDSPVSEGAVGVGLGRSFDAWVSFAWIDLGLLSIAVAAVVFAAMGFAGVKTRFRPGPVLVVLGLAGFVLIAYRLVIPPWDGADREAAPYLALLCCLGIAAGGHLSYSIVTGRVGFRSQGR
jgi:hypothetical protein